MGVKFSHLVWQFATVRAERLVVLLALADWANEDGECWPSVVQVAARARITERAAHLILKELADEGVIGKTAGGGRGVRSHYFIKEETLKEKQGKGEAKTLKRKQGKKPAKTLNEKPCLTNTVSQTGNPEGSKTLILTTLNPDPGDIAIRKNHHEPSIEPSMAPAAPAGAKKKNPNSAVEPFFGDFCAAYSVLHGGVPYQESKGDFVQFAGLRNKWASVSIPLLEAWAVAQRNYFATPQRTYSMADLCRHFGEFYKSARDQYGKPVGGNGNGSGQQRIVGEARPVPGKYSGVGRNSGGNP